jgi:hypothetical protein
MTTTIEKQEILNRYITQFRKLAPDAQKAYGSRATASKNHDTSREYTELLVQYTKERGSLLMLAKELNITYPALRRRVMTADIAPLERANRSKALPHEYAIASESLQKLKKVSSKTYHDGIKECYDRGLSLNTLATYMGLKSAYPLYYGLNNARMRQQ